ncbi:MAG: D-alanine--D-alanine ligase [Flavobacteriaceae bacterium]|nr:D-alanine--D-alanine ligase [Flavobacteriaceae bacterium]
MKQNVAIVMGGYSNEFQISILSGMTMLEHIDHQKFKPYAVYITADKWYCKEPFKEEIEIDKHDFSLTYQGKKICFDVVLNIIHGTPGEDGLLQAYFELINIPHTSCRAYQAALTFNKRDCIALLKPHNIATAENYYLNKGQDYVVDEIIDKVGLPCFVKANKSGSSYGVSKVYEATDFDQAVAYALSEDDEIIVESFLTGKEVSVGIIPWKGKLKVLTPTEIRSDNDFFDYEAKYLGKAQEITPAEISTAETEEVQRLTKMIYQFLKLDGVVRIDFIFHQGKPHFVEVNSNPGMSPESIVPKQLAHDGISITALIDELIAAAR